MHALVLEPSLRFHAVASVTSTLRCIPNISPILNFLWYLSLQKIKQRTHHSNGRHRRRNTLRQSAPKRCCQSAIPPNRQVQVVHLLKNSPSDVRVLDRLYAAAQVPKACLGQISQSGIARGLVSSSRKQQWQHCESSEMPKERSVVEKQGRSCGIYGRGNKEGPAEG